MGIVHLGCKEDVLEQLKKESLPAYKIQFLKAKEIQQDRSLLSKALEQGNTVLYSMDIEELNDKNDLIKLSDKIIIAVDGDAQTASDLKEKWEAVGGKYAHKIETELLVIHREYRAWYPNTIQYYDLAPFSHCYHLCFSKVETIQRTVRMISGNGIGLVVSGGGAKGWAAFGALGAILEKKIPIDYIGGTSIGALMAGFFAFHGDFEGCYNHFIEYLKVAGKSFSFRHLTVPIISFFTGKSITVFLKKSFQKTMLCDLTLPFFAVSANLSSYCEHIWDQGLLWQAVRASIALPPILPPLVYEDQIHVDGGVINNFPVDVMNRKLDHQGTLIGIDISTSDLDNKKYNFPPYLTFWQGLRVALGLKKLTYIGILEILDRNMMSSSIVKTIQNNRICDLIIKPDLKKFGFTEFHRYKEIMAAGYQEAVEKLKSFPSKND